MSAQATVDVLDMVRKGFDDVELAREKLSRSLRMSSDAETALHATLDEISKWITSGALDEQFHVIAYAKALDEQANRHSAEWDEYNQPVLGRLGETRKALLDALKDAKTADSALGVWLARIGTETETEEGKEAFEEARKRRAQLAAAHEEIAVAFQLLSETWDLVDELEAKVSEFDLERDQIRKSEKQYLGALNCEHNRSDDPLYHWKDLETPQGLTRTCRDCGIVETYTRDGQFAGISFRD